MSASLTVDASKLQKALKAFIGNTKAEASKEMRIQARMLCVSLANSTQPFGKDANAKATGEKAVTRDIDRVYKSGPTAVRDIASLPLPRGKTATQNAKQAAAALAGLLQGRTTGKRGAKIVSAAQDLLDRINYKPYVNTKIGVFDQGQAHNKARFGRRKSVPKNQFVSQVVTKDSQLTKYFKEKRGNVGIAKSGWAVCAGLLGGFKGIPKWVYRHTGGGRVNDQSGKGLGILSKPFIQMTNTIPWINAVISTATIQKSIDIQIIKMIKRLGYITAAESKKAGL